MQDAFRYDKEIIDHEYVITGPCSLTRAGLLILCPTHLDLQTTYKELDDYNLIALSYHYNKNIDYEYEVIPSSTNPLLLQPSKERALVENILHLDWIDEGLLIEALQTYLDQFYDEEKLYRVAAYFGLYKDTLNYWIKEAKEDYEV